MDHVKVEQHLQTSLPIWLDTNRPRARKKPTLSPSGGNIAAFLQATSRLRIYEASEFTQKRPLDDGRTFHAMACRNKETGSAVVIKSLHRSSAAPLSSIHESVLQEVKVSIYPAFLNHPNIASAHGILICQDPLEDQPAISLVMEYAEYGSLQNFLSESTSLETLRDFPLMKSLLVDVCAGLDMLHKCHVIHGDVKPENVLIFPDDIRSYIAKIADFGSSVVEETLYGNSNITNPLFAYRGTSLYLPQYVKSRSGRIPFHYMPAVDIYSFGLLLWNVLEASVCSGYHPNSDLKSSLRSLGDMNVDDIQKKFRSDLGSCVGLIPKKERAILQRVFQLCVTDLLIDTSPVPSIQRDGLYKDKFSMTTKILKALIGNGDSSYHDHLSSSSRPFHLGSAPTKESLERFSWQMQCQLFEQTLDTFRDFANSEFDRGRAALQLCSFYSSGIGCRKSNDEAINFLSLAASLGDCTAQILCPRVFSTHEKPLDSLKLVLDSLHDSLSESSTSISEEPDNRLEVSSESESQVSQGSITSATRLEGFRKERFDDGTMDQEMSSLSETDTGSNTDYSLILYETSLLFDALATKSNESLTKDYFWMKVRKIEFMLGHGSRAARFKYDGKLCISLEHRETLQYLQNLPFSQAQTHAVALPCQDGTIMETPLLHHIAACGMLELLKTLIQAGMPSDNVNDLGQTLLHVAMTKGYSKMTRFLVKCHVDPCARDKAGKTPLHYLYMFGLQILGDEVFDEIETVTVNDEQRFQFDEPQICSIAKMLQEAGADVNALTSSQLTTVDVFFSHRIHGTPLHAAITMGNRHAVKALLHLGANPNLCPSHLSCRPIETAAQLHLAEIVEMLLKYGAHLVAEPGNGVSSGTWAMHSVGVHVLPLTRWLLHGVNYKLAARETIEVLLGAAEKESLNVNMTNSDGWTAFQVALQEPGEDDYIVSQFLDCYGVMPPDALHAAIFSCAHDEQNASKVELVLCHGAVLTRDAMTYDDEDIGLTVLQLCVEESALQAARVILRQPEGAVLLHVQDDYGQTALHSAALAGNRDMVMLFLEKGADINTRDSKGLSALGYAIVNGHQSTTSLLLAENADIQIYDVEYEEATILHIAVSRDLQVSKSMLDFLLPYDQEDDQDSNRARFSQLHEQKVIDATEKIGGNTALHLAAHFADLAGVLALLNAGADPRIRNKKGWTPLKNTTEKLRLLLPSTLEKDKALASRLKKCIKYLENSARGK